MTQGNIYEVNNTFDISVTLNKIFDNKQEKLLESCDNFYGILSDNHSSIQAGIVSSMILSSMNANNSYIPSLQNQIAEKYHIVNQFNSLIALETQRQQNDLNKYSEQSDKFDVEYDAWNNYKKSISNSSVRWLNLRSTNSISMDNWVSWDVMFWSSWYSSYNRSIDINFVWFLLILIYISQIMSFVSFIINYKKRK